MEGRGYDQNTLYTSIEFQIYRIASSILTGNCRLIDTRTVRKETPSLRVKDLAYSVVKE